MTSKYRAKKKKEKLIEYIRKPKYPIDCINNMVWELQRIQISLPKIKVVLKELKDQSHINKIGHQHLIITNAIEMLGLNIKDCLRLMVKDDTGNNNPSSAKQ